ncbi:hypothetical protein ACIBIZ_11830 [Nonomuraea spiralis]
MITAGTILISCALALTTPSIKKLATSSAKPLEEEVSNDPHNVRS